MWSHVMCSSLYGGQWCVGTEASGVGSRYV